MTLYNLARMYTTTTGTGTVTLTTAVAGCLTFDLAGVSNGETVNYGIITYDTASHRPTHSEVGTGVYTTIGTTLTRASIEKSTNGGSAITLTGLSEVYICPPASFYNAISTKAPVMWHDQSVVTLGNAFTTTDDTSCRYNWYRFQDTAAILDTWTNGFTCRAGTYTFNALVVKDTSHGILTAQVDSAVTLGTVDLYAASTQRNQILTISSCVLTEGYHKFTGITVSKNASSSGYKLPITKMWFTPASY
jgi:hypothetical protein